MKMKMSINEWIAIWVSRWVDIIIICVRDNHRRNNLKNG